MENSLHAKLNEDEMLHQLRDLVEIEGQSSPQFVEGKEYEGSAFVHC